MGGLSVDDNFSMFIVMIFMFFNNFIYLLLAAYFENVRPGDHGLARPWHFPVSSVFRLFKKPDKILVNEPMLGSESVNNMQNGSDIPVHVENEHIYENKKIGIKMENLTKQFTQFGKTKNAVDNFSLNIYEGHISVLLGSHFLFIYFYLSISNINFSLFK